MGQIFINHFGGVFWTVELGLLLIKIRGVDELMHFSDWMCIFTGNSKILLKPALTLIFKFFTNWALVRKLIIIWGRRFLIWIENPVRVDINCDGLQKVFIVGLEFLHLVDWVCIWTMMSKLHLNRAILEF